MLSPPAIVNLVPTPVIGGVGLATLEWPLTGLIFLAVLFVLSLLGISIEAVRNAASPTTTTSCDATGDLGLAHAHRQPA